MVSRYSMDSCQRGPLTFLDAQLAGIRQLYQFVAHYHSLLFLLFIYRINDSFGQYFGLSVGPDLKLLQGAEEYLSTQSNLLKQFSHFSVVTVKLLILFAKL